MFSYGGTDYTISNVSSGSFVGDSRFQFELDGNFGTAAADLVLHVGNSAYPLSDATLTGNIYEWTSNLPSWANGTGVCLALTVEGPDVSSVALTSTPGPDNTYAISDTVTATVTFDAAVDITGTPQLELDFAGTPKLANCTAATNVTTMACEYEVVADDVAAGGVAIAANKLTLNSGTIYATGNTVANADLDHTAVAIDADHKVDGIRPTLVTTGTDAPRTSTDGMQVILTFSEDIGAVSLSDIDVTVTFSEAVDIAGSPELELDFDGTAKAADCATDLNTTTMACSYTVAVGDSAPNGIAIGANALTLTGGTIRATGSTTISADLDHTAVAIAADHKVDGIRPTLLTTGSNAPTTSTDGTKVILTFSEDIGGVSRNDITIQANSITLTTTAASANATKVEITLTTALTTTATNITVELSADAVVDAAGNGILALAATTVTNAVGTPGSNTAPTFANLTETRSVAENSAVGTNVGAPVTATDGNNDQLTYTLEGDDAVLFSISTSGQIHTISGVTYDSFPYTVIVKADDGNGGTDTVTVTITLTDVDEPPRRPTPPPPVNYPPLAVDDTADTPEDTPVTISVLGNDSDPEGNTLTVVEVSAPTHGTAVVADTGAVVYTPEPDFHGTDRFTYVVGDGSGLTARAAVDVTVLPVNDPPLAVDDAADTPEDTPVTISVLGNDSDGDGDALTVVEASAPTHGTAAVDTGEVVYTPEPDFHGTDSFTYVVGDGSGLTARAAVDVTVRPVNDPPLAAGVIPDRTLDIGDEPAALDLIPFFADRDGDALVYTAVVSDQAVRCASPARR